MSLHDDKTLVAYVDGELDPREAWLVQIALDRDPALRDKVRVMRETAAVLRATFAPLAREALPAALDRLLDGAAPLVVSFPLAPRQRARAWVPGAMAAGIALAVGLGGGFQLGVERSGGRTGTGPASDPAVPVVPTRIAAAAAPAVAAPAVAAPAVAAWQQAQRDAARPGPAGALQAALEKKLSGSELTWTDERSLASVTVEPIRTYQNDDATFCREYRETFAEPSRSPATIYGLACRGSEGRWAVQYYLVPGADAAAEVSY